MSSAEAVVFAVGGSLLFAHAVMGALDAFSFEWRAAIHQALATGKRCLRQVHLWMHEAPDELAREVTARMRARRLRHFQGFLPVFRWYSCLCALTHVFHVARSSEKSGVQDALVAVGLAMCMLADWCPWLVTGRSVDGWCSGAMAAVALYAAPGLCPPGLRHASRMFRMGWIMLICWARLNPPVFIFWNGVHILCTDRADLVEATWFLEYLCLLFVLCPAVMGLLAARMKAECRRDIERAAMEEKQAAMDALMQMAFDAASRSTL